MTQDPHGTTLTEDEQRVQDAVRGLPRVAPHYGVRARLRREFSTGQFTPPRPQPILPPPRWVVMLRRSPIPVAVAAAVLFAFLNRGPSWELVTASSQGSILVDGTAIPVSEAGRVSDRLGRGGTFTVPEGSLLTFRNADHLFVQVAGGSELSLPSPPGRWVRKTFHGRVDRGEARFMTGTDFPGHRLHLEMPVGTADITGTLFSVVTDGQLSCVCVVEGIAWVGRTENNMEAVPPGMRKLMFADTRPEVVLSIEPGHAAGLVAFRDSLSR